jgi:hypothetical protein
MTEEIKEEGQSIEDNLPMVSYIMMHRMYDLLTIIANHFEPEKTAKMVEYHEAGYLLGPSPSYSPDNSDENS